jgi:hypothetical protein
MRGGGHRSDRLRKKTGTPRRGFGRREDGDAGGTRGTEDAAAGDRSDRTVHQSRRHDDQDGEVWISLNNLASGKPSCIGKITKDDQIEKITICRESGNRPLQFAGHRLRLRRQPVRLGHQNHAGKGLGKSRVLRVVFKDGKAVRAEVVATGLHAANGLAAWGDAIYVNETTFGQGDPMDSGTYRFSLSELKADAPVRVDGTLNDPHVVFTLKTRGPVKVGANGLCFDENGNLFVSNFGDREIWRGRVQLQRRS